VNPHPRALAGIEGRLPPEIAEKAESDGIAKADQDAITLLTLGVLGGGFIAFGAIFGTVALTGAEGVLLFGIARVVVGVVFALGLSLVLVHRAACASCRPSPVRRRTAWPYGASHRRIEGGIALRPLICSRHTLQHFGLS
jgi:hypothetical protein